MCDGCWKRAARDKSPYRAPRLFNAGALVSPARDLVTGQVYSNSVPAQHCPRVTHVGAIPAAQWRGASLLRNGACAIFCKRSGVCDHGSGMGCVSGGWGRGVGGAAGNWEGTYNRVVLKGAASRRRYTTTAVEPEHSESGE